jgi:hypothetical protein
MPCQRRHGRRLGPGYSRSQLDEAQERYRLRFPPDLVGSLRRQRPVRGYDWHLEDPRIRKMLQWPFEALHFDIEHGLWWPDWGARPGTPSEREEVLRYELGRVSQLIPLIGHRFLPESPHAASNPVFSMHGFDTIVYGADLEDYFRVELSSPSLRSRPKRPARHIPFWSDIAEDFGRAFPDDYPSMGDGGQG